MHALSLSLAMLSLPIPGPYPVPLNHFRSVNLSLATMHLDNQWHVSERTVCQV